MSQLCERHQQTTSDDIILCVRARFISLLLFLAAQEKHKHETNQSYNFLYTKSTHTHTHTHNDNYFSFSVCFRFSSFLSQPFLLFLFFPSQGEAIEGKSKQRPIGFATMSYYYIKTALDLRYATTLLFSIPRFLCVAPRQLGIDIRVPYFRCSIANFQIWHVYSCMLCIYLTKGEEE